MEENLRNVFLKKLYERNKDGGIKPYCTCTANREIPIIISKRKDTYYIKRKDASIEHSPSCKFDGEYMSKITGWDVYPDGNIYVMLQDRMYSTNQFSNPKINCQMTLDSFMERWMNLAWEVQTKNFYKNKKGNVTYNDFYSSLQYWATRIKFSERISVKDLLGSSKSKSYNLLKENLRMLVVYKLDKKEKFDKNKFMLHLKNPDTDYTIDVTCTKNMWEEAIEKSGLQKGAFMVAGFVELIKDTPLNFLNMCLIPISNEGVVINNEFEKKLINCLHKKKRFFIRSFDSYKVFETTKPMLMLIDSTPMSIVETFEKSKLDKEYWVQKEAKLNYFISLSNYKLITWDAFNDEKLFKF